MDEEQGKAVEAQAEAIPLVPPLRDGTKVAALAKAAPFASIIFKALALKTNIVLTFTTSHAHSIKKVCAEGARIVRILTLEAQQRRSGGG